MKTLIANFASRLKPTTSAARLYSNVNLNGCNNPFMCILQIHAKQRSQILPRGFSFSLNYFVIVICYGPSNIKHQLRRSLSGEYVSLHRIFCLHALTISEIPTTTSFDVSAFRCLVAVVKTIVEY